MFAKLVLFASLLFTPAESSAEPAGVCVRPPWDPSCCTVCYQDIQGNFVCRTYCK